MEIIKRAVIFMLISTVCMIISIKIGQQPAMVLAVVLGAIYGLMNA